MHFVKIASLPTILATLALAAPSSSSGFVPADYYQKNTAPRVLARIAAFRDSYVSNGSTLTTAQSQYLDQLVTIVTDMDTSAVQTLEIEGEDLFGKELKAAWISDSRKGAGTTVARSSILARTQVHCFCATGSDECDDDTTCQSNKQNGCATNSDNCGFLGLYTCDGLCVQ
jgi:hypothetical protein